MSITSNNQSGASHVILVLSIVVLALIGGIGYRVLTMDKNTSENTTKISVTDNNNDTARDIKTKEDITKAEKDIDAIPVDDDLNTDQLDNDINSLQ